MSFLHPFHRHTYETVNAPTSRRYSLGEIHELQKSIQAHNEYVSKSFVKGRAKSGDGSSASGLDVQSKVANLADCHNELQQKRLLRIMSNNVIVQSILRTRDAQLAKYCHPARYSNDNVGFKIVPTNVKADGQLTKRQQKDIRRIERFIYNTGAPDAIRPSRDKLPAFVSKLVYNKFVYDQINVERVYDPDNPDKLDHFNMVDAGTVVLDRTPRNKDAPRTFRQFVSPGESKNDAVKFDEKHMTFVEAHGGGVGRHGYGHSCIAACFKQLEEEDSTEDFNGRFFTQGGTTRGILMINTGTDDQTTAAAMKALRQQWQSTAQGLSGAWKIPMVSGTDMKYVNLTQNSKDMEFEKWLTYLINIVCAACQMQPDEINFPNRGGGAAGKSSGGAMNEGSSQRSKMKQSRDKGLRPLMDFIQDFINDHILSKYAPQYRFMFTLGDDRDEERHETIMSMKLQNGMTINEWRKQEGLPQLNTLDNAYSKFAGQEKDVVQQLQILEAIKGSGNLDTSDQAKSDVKNNANPNHQNVRINPDQPNNQNPPNQQQNQNNQQKSDNNNS